MREAPGLVVREGHILKPTGLPRVRVRGCQSHVHFSEEGYQVRWVAAAAVYPSVPLRVRRSRGKGGGVSLNICQETLADEGADVGCLPKSVKRHGTGEETTRLPQVYLCFCHFISHACPIF